MDSLNGWPIVGNAECRVFAKRFPMLSTNYIMGEGNSTNPQVMIIGEAPGAQEDIKGRPFVGSAGVVLRRMMRLAGLNAGRDWVFSEGPSNCWLTNTVKFRPPGNSTPTDKMVDYARPFLKREWKFIGRPRVIVCVGAVAYYAVTRAHIAILDRAGQPLAFGDKLSNRHWVWPMVHPSFGLRNPSIRPSLENDWATLGEWLAHAA